MGQEARSRRTTRMTSGPALAVAAAILLAGCSGGSSGVHLQTIDPPSSSSTFTAIPGSSPASSPAPTTSSIAAASSRTPTVTTTGATTASTTPKTTGTNSLPSNFTAAQQQSAKAALAAFAGFVEVSNEAQANPTAKNWASDIRKYAADPTAAQTLSALTTLVTAKVHAVVSSTYEQPIVKSADSHEVVMQVCVDATKASIADASGKPVKLRPPAHPRTLLTFNVYRYAAKDGGWLVSETVVPNPVKTC